LFFNAANIKQNAHIQPSIANGVEILLNACELVWMAVNIAENSSSFVPLSLAIVGSYSYDFGC
jgi:hypothetical protein